MDDKNKNLFAQEPVTPWYSLLLLILFVMAGLFVGQAFGMATSLLFSDLTLDNFNYLLAEPLTANKRIPILLLQGIGTFGGFIMGSWIYMKVIEKKPLSRLFQRFPGINWLAITAVLVLSFMFVNTLLIEWNANVVLPDFLKGFDSWARAKEDELKRITEFLINFRNGWEFALGFLVIALIPAFGEELLFRGLIQGKLQVYLKNGHLAIWITAILFSAFHLQFMGLVPRMMLGVLFGYLYYWSGSLWYPVFAHFLNNGFTLVMVYFYNLGILNFDIENEDVLPWPFIFMFTIFGFVLIYFFRMHFKPDRSSLNG